MNKQNSHQKPSRRNQVNAQQCNKETRTESFPGHVGRSMRVHELVTNDKPSLQTRKEAAGHITGPQ